MGKKSWRTNRSRPYRLGIGIAMAIIGLDVAIAQEHPSGRGSSKPAISKSWPTKTNPSGTAAGTERNVIVTAQRRKEGLQKVPIAITVIRGRRLENLHLRRAPDISLLVPNMTSRLSGRLAPSWSLRGVGTAN